MQNRVRIGSWIIVLCSLSGCITGCVNQRLVNGEPEPAQQFQAASAAQARLSLALEYLAAADYQQAKFNLEKAASYAPDNIDVLLGQAYYHQQVGQRQAAEQVYRQALQQNRLHADALNNYGVLLCQAGRYEEADKLFQQAIQAPANFRVGDSYENAANCAVANGNKQAGLAYFAQAERHAPQDSTILERYAALLLELERWRAAEKLLQRRAKQPQVTADYLWLEVQLAQGLGNEQRARRYGTLLESQFPNALQTKHYRQSVEP